VWELPFIYVLRSADQNNVTYHILAHKLCHQRKTTVTTATTAQPFKKPNPRMLKQKGTRRNFFSQFKANSLCFRRLLFVLLKSLFWLRGTFFDDLSPFCLTTWTSRRYRQADNIFRIRTMAFSSIIVVLLSKILDTSVIDDVLASDSLIDGYNVHD
jgi:hypothetical protein